MKEYGLRLETPTDFSGDWKWVETDNIFQTALDWLDEQDIEYESDTELAISLPGLKEIRWSVS